MVLDKLRACYKETSYDHLKQHFVYLFQSLCWFSVALFKRDRVTLHLKYYYFIFLSYYVYISLLFYLILICPAGLRGYTVHYCKIFYMYYTCDALNKRIWICYSRGGTIVWLVFYKFYCTSVSHLKSSKELFELQSNNDNRYLH